VFKSISTGLWEKKIAFEFPILLSTGAEPGPASPEAAASLRLRFPSGEMSRMVIRHRFFKLRSDRVGIAHSHSTQEIFMTTDVNLPSEATVLAIADALAQQREALRERVETVRRSGQLPEGGIQAAPAAGADWSNWKNG